MEGSSCSHSLAPQVIRRINKEIAELIADPPEGIKMLSNEENISEIIAIIKGPSGTPYFKGYFKVKLVLGKDFPVTPPKGFFATKIFHPNVGRFGEICVDTLKKDWKSDLGIKHILLVIKCLLIIPNPESALNEEAAKLHMEDYEEYYKRARMITEIHAKPPAKENNTENCAINRNSALTRKQPEEGDNGTVAAGPATKKQAAAGTSVGSKMTKSGAAGPAATTVKRVDKEKKRTLKRL